MLVDAGAHRIQAEIQNGVGALVAAVLAQLLPDLLFVAGDVQQVVGQLEAQAQGDAGPLQEAPAPGDRNRRPRPPPAASP